jgi:major intracellular serine protease
MEKNTDDVVCHLLPYVEEEMFFGLSDDQKFGWQIIEFNLPEAWKTSMGENVTIAVIDTGVQINHPDLKENVVSGFNFIHPEIPPLNDTDIECHGTHVSGIIAANHNESGMVGVAPKAKIMPLRVLDKYGIGNMKSVVAAINYAVEHGADLISMSLGTKIEVPAVREAITNAASKNIICFVAAGNAGTSDNLMYPANYPETISVGAIDENYMRADFSCTGRLDFVAPGVRIFSTVPTDKYAFLSGTSQAAPFVAGLAALYLSAKRKIDPNVRFSADKYREVFKKYTVDIKNLDPTATDPLKKKFWEGFGIIQVKDFEKLIKEALSQNPKESA